MQRDDGRPTTRLYLITPPAFDPDRFAGELEQALAGGDVACLQLRLKDVDDAAIRTRAIEKRLKNVETLEDDETVSTLHLIAANNGD